MTFPLSLNGETLLPGHDVEIDGYVYSYETLTIMSEEDRAALGIETIPLPDPEPEPLAEQARRALQESDLVAIRCLKAGVAYPTDWLAYDDALRAIVNGGEGPLPERPAYPEGS